MTEFKMPSLGADMAAGTLREWRKKPGDRVKRGDIIAEVETQKGIIEVEVFSEGIVGKLLLRVDEKVPVGTPMAQLLTEAEWLATQPVSVAAPTVITTVPAGRHRASPLARRMAEVKGINLETITGSGEQGAIVAKDVEGIQPQPIAPAPVAEPGIRSAVAAAMARSNREIPHYYLQSVIDLKTLTEFLSEKNRLLPPERRILPAAAFVKAVAMALKECPDLNGWWKEDKPEPAAGIHIGFAISLRTGGLVNPAIADADKLTLEETMEKLSDLIARARGGMLRSSEFTGGSITLSSIGTDGAEALFGVIHPPQVALVGIGPVREAVLAVDGMVAVRPAVTITLAADHRATDGIYGSRFLRLLGQHLQHPQQW